MHHITRAEARAAGMTDDQLAGPGFRRVIHGVYVPAGVVLTPQETAAAVLSRFSDDASASHATAARILGAPLPRHLGVHVTVSRPSDRRRIRGVTCHLIANARVQRVGDIWVSDPAQVFIDLAGTLRLADLVAVGDYLVRHRMVDRTRLERRLVDSRQHGISAARTAAAYVRERVDSAMETKLRLLIVLGGLPEPEVNPEMVDSAGRRRRYDLLYRRSRTIIEYDGRQHAESPDQWRSDLGRREALDEDGWRIIVVTAEDMRRPEVLRRRIGRVLHQRGEPGV